ncbi:MULTISPECIES: TPM domain-containing protein [Glycomyces]|uniref:Exonuclease VII small subunit n=2 Tax=Glycomyces TaxID=58113 RepID=A0A9X3PGP8_9ACTN|nr:TPM domain-containing protein [Glycomyces lechevalierae]MDA1383358.1 TPM domain-containing protein [Glycomyces lechevalierae]MDR7336363.1 exonuclease VII small subunit [Glycomyces lechevalierae]
MSASVRYAAAVLAALWFALAGSAAYAVAPPELDSGAVTDQVGAIADRGAEVDAAIDELRSEAAIGLYVAYVDSFSGYDPQDWANQTAMRSDLGTNDILLAVATGDRRFSWSVESAFPLSDEQLNEVATTAIEPALADDDWAGAAIAAADGYREQATGESSGGAGWVILLVVLAAIALVVFLVWRRRRAKTGAPPGDPVPRMSTEDLDREASRLLVEGDDAVRTSDQDLGFAVAEFGQESTAKFAAALDTAKSELAEAFRLRQTLDDEVPDTEEQHRAVLTEIVDRLTKADKELDGAAAEFEELRDLGRRAPEAIEKLTADAAALAGRTGPAKEALAALAAAYPASAFATVAANAEDAEDRLAFADRSLTEAREALTAGENGRAAVGVRAAEGGLAQAKQLLDAVTGRRTELAEAERNLPGLVASLGQDIAEAERKGDGSLSWERLRRAAADARAVTASIEAARAAGPVDPLDAVRRLEQTQAAIGGELRAVRDEQEQRESAKAQLAHTIANAAATAAAVEDYINTNRGGVGTEARTRLNEANQQLDAARALEPSDPVQALARAQRADQLAAAASRLAQQDVNAYRDPGLPGGFSGGMGGGGNAGAMLGGILLGGILNGSGGRGGGFGSPGSSRRRGPSPGSFGGAGTRRGGGGRF